MARIPIILPSEFLMGSYIAKVHSPSTSALPVYVWLFFTTMSYTSDETVLPRARLPSSFIVVVDILVAETSFTRNILASAFVLLFMESTID